MLNVLTYLISKTQFTYNFTFLFTFTIVNSKKEWHVILFKSVKSTTNFRRLTSQLWYERQIKEVFQTYLMVF